MPVMVLIVDAPEIELRRVIAREGWTIIVPPFPGTAVEVEVARGLSLLRSQDAAESTALAT